MRQRLVVIVAAVAAVASGCQGCEGLQLNDATAIPACGPDVLDFGNVDVSQKETQSFTLSNTGDRDFDEITITLDPSSDPAFAIATRTLPTVVAPSASETIDVSAQPVVANDITGKIHVHGRRAEEGARVADEDKVFDCDITLKANAVNNGLPRIECTPDPLEFGLVGQNDVGFENITCKNLGVRDLIVDEVRLDKEPGSPFSTSVQVPSGTVFHPNDSLSVRVSFSPADTEPHTATLHVLSNDPNSPDTSVVMNGRGSVAPSCRIEPLDGLGMLEPETTVRLNGVGETTISGAYISHYLWALTYRPPGSTTTLESQGVDNPTGQELDVECGPAGMGEPCSTRMDVVADLAGRYIVTLIVEDSTGIRSAPCTSEFRAVPKEQLHVQLVWDHPTADLDLHFQRGTGPTFNHLSDVYFSNRFPTWWGTDAMDPRNPRLDVDDQGGFGPENVNVTQPEPGAYRVSVHYWNAKTQGDPSTLATVRIYCKGQLASEQAQFFTSDQVMWDVLDISWPSDPDGQCIINPLGGVQNFPRPF